MKLSVSLPVEDVAFLDSYIHDASASSRSALLHRAVGLLREEQLETAYAAAWKEWENTEDASLWSSAVGDGIS